VRAHSTDERLAIRPAIETIAHHLRRLADRLTDEGGSSGLRFAAAQRAYDHHLRAACTALGVEEHLDELVGVDQAIERTRVEGRLQELGLVLRNRAGRRVEPA
jgi:hypothetical protein